MAKRSAKAATPTDKIIGQNIRKRRLQLEMTQVQLAKKLGVTFQQLQKYEKGFNRVGSGRLYQIAALLEAPVMSLFEGEKRTASTKVAPSPYDKLQDPMTLQLLTEFSKIKNREIQWAVLTLAERLANAK
jgi:transcriptional regulator with XRE-family HTH domain